MFGMHGFCCHQRCSPSFYVLKNNGMKWQSYFPVGVFAALFALSACLHDDDNGPVPPDLTEQDKRFMVQASYGNWGEVALGNLAPTRAADSGVLAFGQKMEVDHTQAQLELASIAWNWNLSLPDAPDSAHTALRQRLQAMSGHSFDTAYIRAQVADHAKTITLFEDETTKGDQPLLKNYANKYLPVIRMHKAMADSLAMKLTGP